MDKVGGQASSQRSAPPHGRGFLPACSVLPVTTTIFTCASVSTSCRCVLLVRTLSQAAGWTKWRTRKGLFAVPDDLIRVVDAAAILGVSLQRVNQLRVEGKLSAVDVSGMGHTRILHRRSEVERLRAERGVGRYGRT